MDRAAERLPPVACKEPPFRLQPAPCCCPGNILHRVVRSSGEPALSGALSCTISFAAPQLCSPPVIKHAQLAARKAGATGGRDLAALPLCYRLHSVAATNADALLLDVLMRITCSCRPACLPLAAARGRWKRVVAGGAAARAASAGARWCCLYGRHLPGQASGPSCGACTCAHPHLSAAT